MSVQFGELSTAEGSANVAFTDISALLQSSKPVFALTTQQPPSIQHAGPEPPAPPKKPLSPYMTFSKEIWPRVKMLNKNATVCEIGAVIGRLWRELDESTKQRYNDAFISEKQRYDTELQAYLRATGLQASDLAKPRPKRKEPLKTMVSTMPAGQTVVVTDATVPADGLPPFSLVWSRGPESDSSAQLVPNGSVQNATGTVSANAAGSTAYLLTPFGSQSIQSYTLADALDTTTLSAETISQLRVVNGTGSRSAGVLVQPAAVVASTAEIEAEVVQLRNALSERTLEAQRLSQELERANRIVEELRELCQEQAAASSIDDSAAVFA